MLDLIELGTQDMLHLREWNLLMQWARLASCLRSFTVPASTRDDTVSSETLLPVSWMLWVWGQVPLVRQQVVHLQFPQRTLPSEMKQREECPKEKRTTTVQCSLLTLWRACTLHLLGGMVVQKQRGTINSDKGRSREQRHHHFAFRQPNVIWRSSISLTPPRRLYDNRSWSVGLIVNKITGNSFEYHFQKMLIMVFITRTLDLPKICLLSVCFSSFHFYRKVKTEEFYCQCWALILFIKFLFIGNPI